MRIRTNYFKQNLLILLILLFSAVLSGQQNESTLPDSLNPHLILEMDLSNSVDYYYELIKFYILEEEFDLALTYLDSISSNMTDSLYYFKGLSYKGKEDWDNAALNFGASIKCYRHKEIMDAATNQLKATLKNLPPMLAIEKLSGFINDLNKGELLAHFLFIMAWVYEENQLFEEANDVYQTIIRETNYEDKINTKLKIATNYIFLKEFANAKTILQPIIALNDSIYNQDAIFYNYIANFSLEDFASARTDLLRLYLEYPDHPNKAEILQGLAKVFEKEQQYILSWYMLTELMQNSNEVQKFVIQQEIERLIDLIGSEEIKVDQFEYLKPVFDEQFIK